jgi:hypothetical protein
MTMSQLTYLVSTGADAGPHAATHASGGTDPIAISLSQVTGLPDALEGMRWVDALSYGAEGDGVTDDTAALQAIIDDHRIAYLRPGHTFLASTLTMTSGSGIVSDHGGGYVQAGQVPPDAGAVGTLKLKGGTDAPLILVPEAATHVRLMDVELNGNDFEQTVAMNLIDCPASTSGPVEMRLSIDNVWAHNSKGRVLFVGADRLGAVVMRSIFSNALQEVVAFWGHDVRFSQALIGISSADGLKIGGDVYSVTDTEVFSCDGAGLVIEANRGSIHGCAIDRNGGHGAYIASGVTDVTFTSCVWHTNSMNANGAANHVEIKDGASARFVACQWANNDEGENLALWCVGADGAAGAIEFVSCGRDAAASASATPSIWDPLGLCSLWYKARVIGSGAALKPSAVDAVLAAQVEGDAAERFTVGADGSLAWGTGAAAADVRWYRGGDQYLRTGSSEGIRTAFMSVGGNTPATNYQLRVGGSYIGTAAAGYGIHSEPWFNSYVTNGIAMATRLRTNAGTFELTSGSGLTVYAPTIGAGSSVVTTYGVNVGPQTAGTTASYGVAVGAASTQTLWLSSNADNTTAAAGIGFGLSRDTNLYRSAAGVLKTDGAFVAGGTYVAVGVNPALSGAVRLANNQGIAWRNSTNIGQAGSIFTDSTDRVDIDGTAGVRLRTAGATQLSVSSSGINIVDAVNCVLGTTSGTKIGTSATQKLAFYGATPVVQPAATPAAATDATTTQTLVNDLRAKLIALGLIA